MQSIASKIAKISYEIGALKKDKSEKVNYDFHGYESVNAKLKALLHHYNLALIPEITDVSEKEFFIKSFDNYKKIEVEKMLIRTTVKGFISVICGDTGEIFKAPFCGVDQDYGGKSFGQAVTEMVKRFELKLFHISTKQDVDPDSRSDVYEQKVQEIKVPEIITETHEEWKKATLWASSQPDTEQAIKRAIATLLNKGYAVAKNDFVEYVEGLKVAQDIGDDDGVILNEKPNY